MGYLDVWQFQIENTLCNHRFVSVRASTLAYAALMNSLENLRLDYKVLGHIGYLLSQALQIDCNSDLVFDVQSALRHFFLRPQPVNRVHPSRQRHDVDTKHANTRFTNVGGMWHRSVWTHNQRFYTHYL